MLQSIFIPKMHLSFILLTILLSFYSTTIHCQNGTTTTLAPIISCQVQRQCPSTHFCNLRQRICVRKYLVGTSCAIDRECASGKCHDHFCRRSCNSDRDCQMSKEYCTVFSNVCQMKHCGLCTRDAQCANNRCAFLRCASTNCTAALAALQKNP